MLRLVPASPERSTPCISTPCWLAGGPGRDTGRLARKFRAGDDDPVTPDGRLVAPWAALVYDGTPAATEQANQILDAVEIATLPPQGAPAGPDYQQYWINRVRPGLARLW